MLFRSEFFAADEGNATLRNREYVVNPAGAAVLGKSTLEQANNGITPSAASSVVVINQYQHTRMVRRFERVGLEVQWRSLLRECCPLGFVSVRSLSEQGASCPRPFWYRHLLRVPTKL